MPRAGEHRLVHLTSDLARVQIPLDVPLRHAVAVVVHRDLALDRLPVAASACEAAGSARVVVASAATASKLIL